MSDKYIGLKKALAFIASIGLWGVSMYFSYKGFEFESSSVLWFGVVMALVVTVVELVFNTNINKLNPTLIIAGIVCYIYGVYTNVTGFYVLQHGNTDGFFTGTAWLIPVVAGLLAEILPEALFAWALGAHGDGDFVGNVVQAFGRNDTHLVGRARNDDEPEVRPSRDFYPRKTGVSPTFGFNQRVLKDTDKNRDKIRKFRQELPKFHKSRKEE